MNTKGAERWVNLMKAPLDDPRLDLTCDPRVRPSHNTILGFFMEKYSEDFNLGDQFIFGETNKAYRRRINLMKLTSDEIEALPEDTLREELLARRIDVTQYPDKKALVNKALSL